jgi:hypothetical protein
MQLALMDALDFKQADIVTDRSLAGSFRTLRN